MIEANDERERLCVPGYVMDKMCVKENEREREYSFIFLSASVNVLMTEQSVFL